MTRDSIATGESFPVVAFQDLLGRTFMKLLSAVIRPETCSRVQAALAELGLSQMTLSEVWGQGHEHGHTYIYRGTTIRDSRIKRLKLEIAVDDEVVDAAVDAIITHARTERVGDGIIVVTPIEEFIRIRTGEHKVANEKFRNRLGSTGRAPRMTQAIAMAAHG
jgi:nitrogen regulatory protein PII